MISHWDCMRGSLLHQLNYIEWDWTNRHRWLTSATFQLDWTSSNINAGNVVVVSSFVTRSVQLL